MEKLVLATSRGEIREKLDRTREEKRRLDESVPVRASLFIRTLQLERSRDEIFLWTEESHNETGPFLIGPFHPVKNEIPLPRTRSRYTIRVRIKLGISKETYNDTTDACIREQKVRKRPQERRLAVIWIQPRYYRSSLCTILPSAGVIVKDNGISRSDSGGGGVDDDR
ncbi:hypothetical protein ALC62_00891 [Cyphomyrmex costatus]|uniref:Uncharacterized protein n=1 Tax=Cyphomyrmex costatus TaxID=456900 RepID=A0A195D5B7_9HYME|nr:hypothetical protein ALC62_00891 [Cyphomyrmex costatus]